MLWFAHALTLSRLPIAIALVYAYGRPACAAALIALAAATDAADGTLARALQRRGHTRPAIGGWLDPLVDKLFVAIVIATIGWHTGDLVLVALILAREILLVPVAIAHLARGRSLAGVHAHAIGKAATIAQFVALAVAVAMPPCALPFACAAAALGIAAAIHYARRA
jgi:phosphatidylglycerophosphate synthase